MRRRSQPVYAAPSRSRAVAWACAAALLLPACGETTPRPTSVLLITLDTTRADRLGCYGKPAAGTPVLDALAARGVLCEAAYTTAPITLPAHASILTGLTPPQHGARDNGAYRVDGSLETAAELLATPDRRAAAFVAAFPLYAQFGLDQGFEVYDDDLRGGRKGSLVSERPGNAVTNATLRWLEQLDEGEAFFAWTHYYDPHQAWQPPPQFAARFPGDPYQAEIAFVDAQIGRLLEHLERDGRLDDTLVVVVADHGEGLGEHGEETHAELVYDSTMRVPLLLAGPGVPAGRRLTRTVSVVDVLPTLTELLGLPTPDVRGRSLAPLWRGETDEHPVAYLESLYCELHNGWSPLQGVVDGEHKLIVAPRTEGAVAELYALSRDPHERVDLAAREPERVAELRATLAAVLRATPPRTSAASTREATPDELAALAELGYVHDEHEASQAGRHPRDMVHLAAVYSQGRHQLAAGRLDDLARTVERIEADDPGGLMALELRARLLGARAQDDPAVSDAAKQAWSEAVSRNPGRRGFWRGLAAICRQRGELVEAWRHLHQATRVAPATPELQAEIDALARQLDVDAVAATGDEELLRALRETLGSH